MAGNARVLGRMDSRVQGLRTYRIAPRGDLVARACVPVRLQRFLPQTGTGNPDDSKMFASDNGGDGYASCLPQVQKFVQIEHHVS